MNKHELLNWAQFYFFAFNQSSRYPISEEFKWIPIVNYPSNINQVSSFKMAYTSPRLMKTKWNNCPVWRLIIYITICVWFLYLEENLINRSKLTTSLWKEISMISLHLHDVVFGIY